MIRCSCAMQRPATSVRSTGWSTRASLRAKSGSSIGSESRDVRCTMSVKSKIFSAMKQIAEEQKVTLPPLEDDLSLNETGFDSLAFAILVARLEDELGIDPFTVAEDAAFPSTLGEFVRAYENVPA